MPKLSSQSLNCLNFQPRPITSGRRDRLVGQRFFKVTRQERFKGRVVVAHGLSLEHAVVLCHRSMCQPHPVYFRSNELNFQFMNEQQLLARAIEIATEAHHDQKDRYGAPYVLHPLRVMQRLATPTERIVGILHDVVEDTHWTFEQLSREGFPEPILAALRSVTKREGEDYDHFVKRSAADALGKAVKIADLEDNMDLRRLPDLSEKDIPRLQKYLKAWRFLTE